jgi:hypothetical protein
LPLSAGIKACPAKPSLSRENPILTVGAARIHSYLIYGTPQSVVDVYRRPFASTPSGYNNEGKIIYTIVEIYNRVALFTCKRNYLPIERKN